MLLEIVKDFDNSYYCNLGGISEYVTLKQLRTELKDKHDINIESLEGLYKGKFGRKTYYYKEITT